MTVQFGIETCLDRPPARLRGAQFGVLANRASVDQRLRFSWDLLAEKFPGQLRALFTPQHGLWGDAQANMIETPDAWHAALGVPIYSLYSATRRPTPTMLQEIDCLIIDLQDVGTRVYTFAWTLTECLSACRDAGVAVIVLDRPNPVGGTIVEGPLLEAPFRSFVGGASIPMRHALTLGELALFLNRELAIDAELEVVPINGWSVQESGFQGRLWLPPSPNLPTLQSTACYPGMVLLEGMNLSEGRGTTTPFEMIGAPFIDPMQLLDALDPVAFPGLQLLPNVFRPTFDKWAGEACGGVTLHVTEPDRFRSYDATIRLVHTIKRLWPDAFRWIDPPYEYETEKPPIDIISGADRLRTAIDATVDDAALEAVIAVDVDAWSARAQDALLYPRPAGFAP